MSCEASKAALAAFAIVAASLIVMSAKKNLFNPTLKPKLNKGESQGSLTEFKPENYLKIELERGGVQRQRVLDFESGSNNAREDKLLQA